MKYLPLLFLLFNPQSLFAQVCEQHDMGMNGHRGLKEVSFPYNIGVGPGSVPTSCLTLTTGSAHKFKLQRPEFDYKINEGNWVSGKTVSTINNGDSIYIRTTARKTYNTSWYTAFYVDGVVKGNWWYQTVNTERDPIKWRVGPTRQHKQLTDIVSQLVAGDVVELDGDATYDAVNFTRSGAPDLPITIRGISINGRRPIISGNLAPHRNYSRNWTVAFSNSHYMFVENIDVTGGKSICVRNKAHQVTLKNVYIHDCIGNGVLGTDRGSGTLILSQVEVANAGSGSGSGALRHAVYVGTDHHAYPDAKLRVENSYIHNFRGNGIKSRANRTEVINSWIQQSEWVNPESGRDHSFYAIELVGPDGRRADEPMVSIIEGNVLEHRENVHLWSMRMGDDGTGYSDGEVHINDNYFILPEDYSEPGNFIIRAQTAMHSISMSGNYFINADEDADQWGGFGIFNIEVSRWYTGKPLVQGEGNWYPEDVKLFKNGPPSDETLTQWKENNSSEDDDVVGIYFDSESGVLSTPDGDKVRPSNAR